MKEIESPSSFDCAKRLKPPGRELTRAAEASIGGDVCHIKKASNHRNLLETSSHQA
jgi:hypothetical protein